MKKAPTGTEVPAEAVYPCRQGATSQWPFEMVL